MPVDKVKGGYRVQGTNKVHKTREAATKQLQAIKASQNKKKKK